MAESLVNIVEAADHLSVKVSWLYEMCRLKKVPSYKIGAFRRFKVSELEAWLLERKDGPDGSGPLDDISRGQV